MYKPFNDNPRENYNADDCVIRAIMQVTDKSWEEIYTALCVEGFYIGDWGNNNGSWDWYVRSLGFKRYVCPNECPFCYSINDFANEHTSGKYIVATGTHAVAVINGDYYDAWDSGKLIPIYYYTKRKN